MGREDRERELTREKSEVGVAALEAKGLSLYIYIYAGFVSLCPKFLHFFLIAPKILTFCIHRLMLKLYV